MSGSSSKSTTTSANIQRRDQQANYRKMGILKMQDPSLNLHNRETIRAALPCCPCYPERFAAGKDTPCQECCFYFLERKIEQDAAAWKLKFEQQSIAHEEHVIKMRNENYENSGRNNALIERLRSISLDREREIEKLNSDLERNRKQLEQKGFQFDQVSTDFIDLKAQNQDLKEELMKSEDKLKKEQSYSGNLAKFATTLMVAIKDVNLNEDAKNAIAKFKKTVSSKEQDRRDDVFNNVSTQTLPISQLSNLTLEDLAPVIPKIQDLTMEKLAENLVNRDFLELLKKFLLAPDLDPKGCPWRRLFNRKIGIKARYVYTSEEFYGQLLEMFHARCKEGVLDQITDSALDFVCFKSEVNGKILGTFVMDKNWRTEAKYTENTSSSGPVLPKNAKKKKSCSKKKPPAKRAKLAIEEEESGLDDSDEDGDVESKDSEKSEKSQKDDSSNRDDDDV